VTEDKTNDKMEELLSELKTVILKLREITGIDACCIVTMKAERVEEGVALISNALTIGDIPPAAVGAALLQVAADHMGGKGEKKEALSRPAGTTLQ